jgi:uncharacterized membrane protein YjjP (DUF1212 family)
MPPDSIPDPLPQTVLAAALPPAAEAQLDAKIDFVLALGQALHRYGAPAHRLEDVLTVVCGNLGLEARFSSTPTSILAAFGPLAAQRTSLVRVQPGEMNLEKLALLDELTIAVMKGRLPPRDARKRLDDVVALPPPYGPLLTTLCFGLVSMAGAVFFAGGYREVCAAGMLGVLVGFVSNLTLSEDGVARIRDPLAALLVSFLASSMARTFGLTASIVTLSGLIALLPGLTITTAMTELATRHLASGTARLAGALTSLLGLGFGVAVGARVASLVPERAQPPADTTWPLEVTIAAVAIAGVAFLVLERARFRDAPAVLTAGALAFSGARLGAMVFGTELGGCVGAFAVALGSNLYARLFDKPATVPLVPGILLLVPGSVGFKSVLSMLERETVPAMDAAFTMLVVAMSLVAGLLAANAALPPRRAL